MTKSLRDGVLAHAKAVAMSLVAASLVAACGGGGSGPAPAPSTIGAAGGSVSGPNGAQVVVPAGALAVDTAIAIEQSSAGSPALPAGLTTYGAMFAFTPHGTAFATPVTVTVPFSASSVPAGATPVLYKTNAAGAWEQVAGATLNAGTMTAQVTSFSWLIGGNSPPQITVRPVDVAVVEPAAASFTVSALGAPPFFYQWQRSDDGGMTFVAIAGATGTSYTTGATTVAADNDDRYRVLVSNIEGVTTSSAARLTVTATVVVPTITGQPQSVSVATGGNASFSVVATGSNLVYQWQKNGAPIAGQTNASLTIGNAQPADAVSYTVVVSNLVAGSAVNSVTSNAATLTLTAPAAGTWQQLGGALDVGPAGSAGRDLFAAVALDLAGNPVVAWKGRIVGPGTSTNVLHVKRWDGTAWVQLGGNLLLDSARNGGSYSTPSIDIEPTTGQPVVAWSEQSSRTSTAGALGAFDVIVKRWNGSAWQQLGAALNVDANAGAVYPKLRASNFGSLMVAWWETPNFTAAKFWTGTDWITFGAQGLVSTQPTGSQDLFQTALTVDGSGNSFVVFGAPTGPLAAQGSGNGWALLGNGSPRSTSAAAYAWSVANDALGRPMVLLLTRDVQSTAADATAVYVRRLENGTWRDFGPPLLTADRNTVPSTIAISVPYDTSNPIIAIGSGGAGGVPPGPFVQTFATWDGAAWQAFAPNLDDPCLLAVRANPATPISAAPVAACVRSAGDEDIVVYRLAP